MRRSLQLTVALSATLVVIACGDNKRDSSSPTGPRPTAARSADITPGQCTDLATLQNLITVVFGAGSPNVNSAMGKLNNLDKQLKKGNIADAQDQAHNLVSFIQQKASELVGTTAQVNELIGKILCYAGIAPDTFLILPSDAPQVLTNSTHDAGLSLQANTVGVPTLVTFNKIIVPPGSPPPLETKLDQYPGYVLLTQSSPLLKDAIVAVCPTGVPTGRSDHLRLGHQVAPGTTGFIITPPALADFLDCAGITSTQSKMPGWLKSLASLILPKPLYAAMRRRAGGGVGGVASEFSPFGVVDDELRAVGGVGGVGSEFKVSGPTTDPISAPSVRGGPAPANRSLRPGARSAVVSGGVCVTPDAPVGGSVEPECRPMVTLTTFNGTIMTNVPVDWDIVSGGGTVAPEVITPPSCGATYASSAATSTDGAGKAGVCWNLGSTSSGENSVKATPKAGGDAPPGVTFDPPHFVFTATANKLTPTAGATGESVPYDGLPHPGSGTCSNSLTPALSYSGGAVPVNAGSYTLTVTCGGGNVYNEVTATANISISAITPTIAITCPVSVVYTGSALTPCTATVTAINLSQTPTPVHTNNVNVGTATATVNFAAVGNYTAASGSKDFAITAAPTITSLSCPATVAYTGSPLNPCTASVSGPLLGPLPLTVSYTPSTVKPAGSYTASAAYPAGGNYLGSSAGPQGFTVTKLSATATAGSGTMTYGGAVPSLACVVSGLLAVDAGTVTCTTSVPATLVPGNNATTPVVSPANPTNYTVGSVPGTLTIRYVQAGCFASPMFSSLPPTKSSQKKGSNLPIKCSLQNAQGAAVTNASGSLLVEDLGTAAVADPFTAPSLGTAFQGNNVFTPGNGTYSYGLDTGPAGFITLHYYRATATWNDGSKTVGFFYIK